MSKMVTVEQLAKDSGIPCICHPRESGDPSFILMDPRFRGDDKTPVRFRGDDKYREGNCPDLLKNTKCMHSL